MAPRWRLMQKHYLPVPGTQYDYKETTNTGRSVRKVFEVPMFLDPDYPPDQNYPGEIIVAHEGSEFGLDIIFTGDPTPDMAPLNDEAKALTAECDARRGTHSADLGEDGYTGKLLHELTDTLQAFNASTKPSAQIDDTRFDKLMEMNMALIAKLDAKSDRRV